MVTAGPTQEKLDPVRYISNYSTGKMGYAIAERLAELGASVILVSGPVHMKAEHRSIQLIKVVSADQMYSACLQYFSGCHGAVMTAAVADYAPLEEEREKIKRTGQNLVLKLKANKDIAGALGKIKRDDQLLIGFALESQNEIPHALAKVQSKNLDFIVVNSLRDEGAGFGHDTNKITILSRNGQTTTYPLKSKRIVAEDIVDQIVLRLESAGQPNHP